LVHGFIKIAGHVVRFFRRDDAHLPKLVDHLGHRLVGEFRHEHAHDFVRLPPQFPCASRPLRWIGDPIQCLCRRLENVLSRGAILDHSPDIDADGLEGLPGILRPAQDIVDRIVDLAQAESHGFGRLSCLDRNLLECLQTRNSEPGLLTEIVQPLDAVREVVHQAEGRHPRRDHGRGQSRGARHHAGEEIHLIRNPAERARQLI
jgi:hypothetical protein